jgi:hypothetical protein
MAMSIKTKLVKVTTTDEITLLETTAPKTIIKFLSIVLRDSSNSRTINLYFKENSSASDNGVILFEKSIDKGGVYLDNMFLAQGNILSIQCSDLVAGDVIDVIIQYIELT